MTEKAGDLAILNIAAYLFTALPQAQVLREQIHAQAERQALKGTVVLASEGINLFLAGQPLGVNAFWRWLSALPAFAGITRKDSYSRELPSQRLKVKLKREIIRMDGPTQRPASQRAPALAPAVLARWLAQGHDDDGRALTMLDTRNAFEVDAGTFDGAIDWRLAKFSEFPAALANHRQQLEGRCVVSFCTGGIRCEKAALALQDAGLDTVWQLDGGILGYFAATEGAPGWHGRCVVFDARGSLDARLREPLVTANRASPALR